VVYCLDHWLQQLCCLNQPNFIVLENACEMLLLHNDLF
jgi:hypothetical protein